MKTTKTLFRINFYNRRTSDIQTEYTLADNFSEAYNVAMLLMHNYRQFERIKQISEQYPITIVTQSTHGNNINKQPSDTL